MQKKSVLFALFIALLSLNFACKEIESKQESRIEREREREGEPREDSFYAQRAYPAKTIPFGARVNAIEQADNEELRIAANHQNLRGNLRSSKLPAMKAGLRWGRIQLRRRRAIRRLVIQVAFRRLLCIRSTTEPAIKHYMSEAHRAAFGVRQITGKTGRQSWTISLRWRLVR